MRRQFFGSIFATVLTALNFTPVYAETPLAVAYVRSFSISNWDFTCFGVKSDIGACDATRQIGRAKVRIKMDRSEIRVSSEGQCVGTAIEKIRTWDLPSLAASIAVDEVIEHSIGTITSIPARCNANLNPDDEDGIRKIAAFLIDFAD